MSNNIARTIFWVIIASIAALAYFTMSGCIAPKNLAHVCAQRFPVNQFDSVRTEYREGQTVYRNDTVTVDCDSVISSKNSSNSSTSNGHLDEKTRLVRIPCPPCPVRVDTFFREHSSQKEKSDKLEVLQQKYDAANKQAIRLQSGRNTWRLIALICMALLVGGIAIKLLKKRII